MYVVYLYIKLEKGTMSLKIKRAIRMFFYYVVLNYARL